ncbi:alpha-hydroxy acid oxidase [Ramlibacter aurantiacus]|uniref:alpha-hydroxy acid oxidase n=1 Tax=Ramlibacter aurantiacus TaxID=2801330 RepID=UPI00338D3551
MSLRRDPLPAGLHTLADHEAHARSRLDDATWAYFNGGSADGITLAANREAWGRLALMPRVLRRLEHAHTRIQLLGRELAHPILLAPVAYQRLAHPDGELASAQAAAAQGAGFVLSSLAGTPLATVAASVRHQPERGPLWFQMVMQRDRDAVRERVAQVEAAGYEALVVTVDAPVQAPRDLQWRAGFRIPPGLAVNEQPAPAPVPLAPGDSDVFQRFMAAAPDWSDLEWLRATTRLPILLKGVLHPQDALHAVEVGVDALVISNHGGRALDTVPATAAALPPIVRAVAGRVPLLVDGGIRRGTDVLKAIALGAHAVLIGRPLVWGLANAGALGVAHVIRLLRDELEIAMALSGCERLDQAASALPGA